MEGLAYLLLFHLISIIQSLLLEKETGFWVSSVLLLEKGVDFWVSFGVTEQVARQAKSSL